MHALLSLSSLSLSPPLSRFLPPSSPFSPFFPPHSPSKISPSPPYLLLLSPSLPLQTGTLSMSMDRQRYSISSRTQLNDHMSRLLGHVFSPVHDNQMRAAIVKEFWSLDDAKLILNFALTSNFKKLVSCLANHSW